MEATERLESVSDRTERPTLLPTVNELLGHPSFREGLPEVLVGGRALDAPVRWVHTSEHAEITRMLDGRELILSMGTAWPDADDALAAMVDGLADAGVAGLVLELGTRWEEVPAAVREAATRRGLALIALHREVRFVALTEVAHRRIIAGQTEALRVRDQVRALFTGLALRGAPADQVVRELSRTLEAPVVLESLAHEVLLAEIPHGDETALSAWERASRASHRGGDDAPAGWDVVPVEARGKRWGALVALPGPEHAMGRRGVLEQGAIALALGRIADGGADEWATASRRHILDPLLAGRFATAEAMAARLEAAGVPVAGRALSGLAFTGESDPAAIEAWALGAGGRARALEVPHRGLTVALLSLPAHRPLNEALLAPLCGPRTGIAVGRGALDVDGAVLSLHEALDHAAAPGETLWIERRPLTRLLASLRDDHRVLDHGERMLAPLLEHDRRMGGDLQRVLRAALAHPGNRTAAARAAHLSRSVFYQRLDLISRLLDVDLEDGETQTALHIALLSRPGASD